MNTKMAQEVIRIIRVERNERLERLERLERAKTEEDDYYYQIIEEPFINELCLMLLVAIRHEIERELTIFIAKKTSERKGHTHYDFGEWVKEERKRLDGLVREKGWSAFYSELELETGTRKWLEILRELSNSCKHDAWGCSKRLIRKLNLPEKQLYMAPAESPSIREALAKSVGLASDADYLTIAETFVNLASALLSNFKVNLFQLIVPLNPKHWPQ